MNRIYFVNKLKKSYKHSLLIKKIDKGRFFKTLSNLAGKLIINIMSIKPIKG